ncbi:MAG: hypothetical protein ACLUEF_02410 [Faecalibacterium prausnitzii]
MALSTTETKRLRKEDYLPIGSVINMDDRKFRVDGVDFDKDKVSLQDMALADARMPIFRGRAADCCPGTVRTAGWKPLILLQKNSRLQCR